jgi:hypothetical protein
MHCRSWQNGLTFSGVLHAKITAENLLSKESASQREGGAILDFVGLVMDGGTPQFTSLPCPQIVALLPQQQFLGR